MALTGARTLARRMVGVSAKHPAGQYDELDILYRISDTISTNLDLDDVFLRIIKLVEMVTKADACHLFLLMDNELVLRASSKSRSKLIGKLKLKLGEGVAGWAAVNQEMVEIPEKAYEDPRYRFVQELPGDQYEALLSAPLFFRDRVVGVINIRSKQPRHYPDHICNLLRVIGRQVGGAIENARMLEGTKSFRSVVATRKFIDRAKELISRKMHISSDTAYEVLLRESMKSGKSVKEVAEAMMIADEIEK
ncbi:GAF and ANTAR domain-containing protein [Candidatus Uhrbacteria bacterium]|nr:GAF and ANTAR domain-containing protein [Candidatus Uhrbacteria bacterium]